MVNWRSKKLGDWLLLGNGLLFLLLINMVSADHFFRMDLTEEKRYSIKEPTKKMLAGLEEEVYVEVFLDGDMNGTFRRFRKAIEETLEEFRVYSGNKVHYAFTDPLAAVSQKAQNEFVNELLSKGIQRMPVVENHDGERIEKIIFPGALVSAGGFETAVMLFKGKADARFVYRTQSPQEVVNESLEGLEYQLASAIHRLSNTNRKQIGFITGHGELDSIQTASVRSRLADQYDLSSVFLSGSVPLQNFDALLMAKPVQKISEQDKFKLDQYLMHGGKLLIFADRVDASMDSASRDDYFAYNYETGLDDLLFRYGIRINPDLVQDRVAFKYPVITGMVGNQEQRMQMEWPFFPLVHQYAAHPITRNMDASLMRFVSSMDTVKATGILKTPLMFTSPYTRVMGTPVKVGINDLRQNVKPESFNQGSIPLGYLLEGSFTSLFKNRFLPEGEDKNTFKEASIPTKIIVVSDGDFIRNDVNPRTGQPQQLGFDPFSRYTFANEELVMNMMAALTDGDGLIHARNKEVKIRPLDKEKIKAARTDWQIINMALPLLLLVIFGVIRTVLRKRKYSTYG